MPMNTKPSVDQRAIGGAFRFLSRQTNVGARTQSVAILLTVVSWTIVSSGCSPKISDSSLDLVGYTAVTETIDRERDLIIIDARTESEYLAGHIPGALHLPLSKLDERNAKQRFDDYDTIIVYGENPGSALAKAMAKRLLLLGVDDVVYFEDGFAEYKRRGGPIETPDQSGD